jgi:hypothetical protein
MSKTIYIKGTEIKIIEVQNADYISLTDMIKSFILNLSNSRGLKNKPA